MDRIVKLGAGGIAIVSAAVVAIGCARALPGTYLGEAIESGTLKLAVPETGQTATNERPPKALPKVTVTVTKRGEGVGVRFGACDLEGKPSGAERVVLSGDCPVTFAGFEGPMAISGTASLVGDAIELSLSGLAKNPTTVATYTYSYKGARQD